MENNILAVSKYYKIDKLAHAVKTGDQQAIQKAGELMSKLVPQSGCIFIPIPSHTGKATYTLDIAQIIADKTNGYVSNILGGKERETLFQQKKDGVDASQVDLGMKMNDLDYPPEMLTNKPVYLVDNVVSTGETYKQAIRTLINLFDVAPKILVLGYVDEDTIQVKNYKPIKRSLSMNASFFENKQNNKKIIISENQYRRLFENIDTEVNDIYNGNIQDEDCPFFNKVFGGGFTVAQMVQYNDPEDRIDYAAEYLNLIGEGKRRIVFELVPDKYILKLSIGGHRWQTKNEYDANLLMTDRFDMFPRIIYQSRDFTWSISEYARPITNADCEEILGIPLYSSSYGEPSLQNFQAWAESTGRQEKNIDKTCEGVYRNLIKTNPWLKKLFDLERHSRGDLTYGTDIGRGTGGIGKALGVVNRNGQDTIVISDGGFIKPFDIQKLKHKYPRTTVHNMENPNFGQW